MDVSGECLPLSAAIGARPPGCGPVSVPGCVNDKRLFQRVAAASRLYRHTGQTDFRLADHDPGDTAHQTRQDKSQARENLENGIRCLSALQEVLYARAEWGVLLIFQAMDAAGKDSCIKHVMSGINPQGCQVYSFKQPSSEELRHDFLWRCAKRLPERGRISIFNRSYYEEVLVTRVHPDLLAAQNIPPDLLGASLWADRYEDIVNFERFVSRNGFLILKFFLHVSKDEQRKRFLKRLNDPSKNWKFSGGDLAERDRWEDYQQAYEDMIRATATPFAPWYVIPADHKWFTRQIVAAAVIDGLLGLDLAYPGVSEDQRRGLTQARRVLEGEPS